MSLEELEEKIAKLEESMGVSLSYQHEIEKMLREYFETNTEARKLARKLFSRKKATDEELNRLKRDFMESKGKYYTDEILEGIARDRKGKSNPGRDRQLLDLINADFVCYAKEHGSQDTLELIAFLEGEDNE